MVLKNFIHYLINKYLKNYIERFDYEKVKLNLKSGSYSLLFLIINSFYFRRQYLLGESSSQTRSIG